MGGSNKKVTVGYKYYLGVLFGLWKGPVDKITHIAVDKRTAWLSTEEGREDFASIDKPELFGGEAREGGISGTVDFEYGESDQLRNAYLELQLGSEIPAYRGITTAVLNQCYMGNNPYLKPWSFRGERIHLRQDGIEQWYDSKAEIPSLAAYWDNETEQSNIVCRPSASFPLYQTINFNFDAGGENYNPDGLVGATYDDPNGPVVATITATSTTDIFIIRKLPGTGDFTKAYVMGWTASGIPPGEPWATNRFVVTTPNNVSTLYWPNTFDDVDLAEAYALNQADVLLTGHESYRIWLWDDIEAGGGDLNPTGGGRFYAAVYTPEVETKECYSTYSCNDMNPAHIIRECLTDPDWGMGYAEADIDDDAFMTAADTLYDELFGLSITWTREGPLVDFVNEILRHIDGVLYVSRDTGRFVLNLVREDYSVSNLVVLNESNVVSVSNANRPAVADLVSTVTVNYYDRATGEQGSITRHNQSLLQVQQGGGGATTINYPAITSTPLADRVCLRDLVTVSSSLLSCQIEVGRAAEDLNGGDPFVLDWPDQEINFLVMRVQQITLGDSEKQTIVIEAVEDVFAMPPRTSSVGNVQGGIWSDPISGDVLPAVPRIVVEMPYYEMAINKGTTYIDDVLTDDADAGFLLAAGARQGVETNARLQIDSGAGFEDAQALDFCPGGVTLYSISRTATTVYVSGADFDLVENNTLAQIGGEIVRIDGVGQDSAGVYYLTIGRGVLDTVPAVHSAGAAVVVYGYDFGTDLVQYTAAESIDVMIRPQLGSTLLAVEDTPVDEVVMDSRAIRPYPPGDLKVDGSSYPPLVSAGGVFYTGDHTITWAHRDRLQQTGGIAEDYTDSDIGPEAGTTYTLDVYATLVDDSTVAMQTVTGITGNSYMMSGSASVPAPDDTISVHFKITAVRDGYTSWQSPECELIAVFPGQDRILQDGTLRTLEDGTVRTTES